MQIIPECSERLKIAFLNHTNSLRLKNYFFVCQKHPLETFFLGKNSCSFIWIRFLFIQNFFSFVYGFLFPNATVFFQVFCFFIKLTFLSFPNFKLIIRFSWSGFPFLGLFFYLLNSLTSHLEFFLNKFLKFHAIFMIKYVFVRQIIFINVALVFCKIF